MMLSIMRATAAEAELRGQRQSLAEAVGQLYEQAGLFGEYARPDLRPLAGVTATAPWPDPARWPDPAHASEDLVALLTGTEEPSGDPAAAVRGLLPPGAAEILGAFAEAIRAPPTGRRWPACLTTGRGTSSSCC